METKTIYSAIAAIMGEVEAIGKDKTNAKQGFKFRGIDDVYNSLHPLMAKHKVFSVPEVLSKESSFETSQSGNKLFYEKLMVRYTFFTEDGSSVQATVCGIGMDSGDKAANKAMAIAHKYALLQVFAIPTEDMVDPDSETPPPSVDPMDQRRPEDRPRQNAGNAPRSQPNSRPPMARPPARPAQQPAARPQSGAPAVPTTGQVNQNLKTGAQVAGTQNPTGDVINAEQFDLLKNAAVKSKIPIRQYKAWLLGVYGYHGSAEIKKSQYPAILEVLSKRPDVVINYGKDAMVPRQPGEDEEPLPEAPEGV